MDQRFIVIDSEKDIGPIGSGELYRNLFFDIRNTAKHSTAASFQLLLSYDGREESSLLTVPFPAPSAVLNRYEIADGRVFTLADKRQVLIGEGNSDGVAQPGERIAVMVERENAWQPGWYGLKLTAQDDCLDPQLERILWRRRGDWSGTSQMISEVHIKDQCPMGRVISFFGEYDFQNVGNRKFNGESDASFTHQSLSVTVEVPVLDGLSTK